MSSRFLSRLGLRWFPLLCMAALIIGLPVGCAVLQHKERELLFRVEPGTASWYSGLPRDVQEFDLKPASFKAGQNIHGWWWPAAQKDAPAILYLHGVRWNLTGQLFRIEQLRALGFSVLAIDYRGFGQSTDSLPSETLVAEDSRAAWDWLAQQRPGAQRYVFGHSLGAAIAVQLAATVGDEAGLIVEGGFPSILDVWGTWKWGWVPVGPFLTQRFDAASRIAAVGSPVLVVHGSEDQLIKPELGRRLFERAAAPKRFELVEGGSHHNTNSLGQAQYRQALRELFGLKV